MYEDYFGLSGKPFSIMPDPDFIYWAETHDLAFAMLEYGILNQAGFSVITGGIGCGKTTLARQLLRDIDQRVTVGLISNTMSSSERLLEWIMMSLNQPFDSTSYVELYRQFQEYLINEFARGRHVVLIIDEAQNLGLEELEELRMLSNINADKNQLMQLILLGQPQLRDLLQHPSLTQFAQRVSSDFHLESINQNEVAAYIHHRLSVVGAEKQLFSRGACELIASESRGIPRVINTLCDLSLVYAYSKSMKGVNNRVVVNVLEDKKKHSIFSRNQAPQEALPLANTAKPK